jgi:hypothetical protein
LFVALNGVWKLGHFNCAARYDNLNKKYLSSLAIIRSDQCVTPEENDQVSVASILRTSLVPLVVFEAVVDIDATHIYAIDVYGLGQLIVKLAQTVFIDGRANERVSIDNDVICSVRFID